MSFTIRSKPLAALWLTPLLLSVALPVAADLDVVFLIDTTGSMSGEIREAKERVKQLAEALREIRQGERVRIGVVAYRDRGDAFITRVSDLSEDVEVSYRFLASLRAEGGGDSPEDVLSGIASAIHEISWSPDLEAEHQVFLIGDAPPHLDYRDHHQPDDLIAEARARRIVINAIGCRSLSANGIGFFRRVAYATEGSYQHIGRVRAPGHGLAEVMLQAVAPAQEEQKDGSWSPVELYWRGHDPEARTDALLVRRAPTTGAAGETGGCELEVFLPAGAALAGPPQVSLGSEGLQVELTLSNGNGGRDSYAMSPCSPPATPIHISLGG
jgi:uncharacterized protein YegL